MPRAAQCIDGLTSCGNATPQEGAWERGPPFVLSRPVSSLAIPGGRKYLGKKASIRGPLEYVLVDHLSTSKFSAGLACLWALPLSPSKLPVLLPHES